MGVAIIIMVSSPWVAGLVVEVACISYPLVCLRWAQPRCQLASESHGAEDSLSDNTTKKIHHHYTML